MTALAWRQYRLERRMFWRNPTAAFFQFLLPLLLLILFGAVFAGREEDLDVIVPGIAGVSVMSATFVALAYNLTFLRETGVLKRLRGTPMPAPAYFAGVAGSAISNVVLQLAIVVLVGHLVLGVAWPQDWLAMGVFVVAGRDLLRLARRRPLARDPQLGVRARVRQRGLPADADDRRRLLRRAGRARVLRDIAEVLPLKHLVDGLSGAMVHGEGLAEHGPALAVLGVWTAAGLVLAIRGFSWDARRG